MRRRRSAELWPMNGEAASTELIEEQLRPYVPELLLRWPGGVRYQTLVGTLVSADISGFTALSERLAVKGREGAEELTMLINDCFAGMIQECVVEGGDVLKFGGDAILVFFDGDQHVQRACRASIAMRRAIKRPRVTSDGRRVKLAVSIGVHAGEHTFYVVANGHQELIVSGPSASATVDAEGSAHAGEILLSSATAELLATSWLGETITNGVLLKRTFGSPSPTDVRPTHRHPTEFVPPEQVAQIVAEAANEHRQVTVSFLEFAGTDALKPDILWQRLQDLATSVWAACERFGVFWLATDAYHDGGKFVLAAGAPISHGGDEDRMLRAMRDIVDADPGLNLRAGVNRGFAFAGDLGSASRRVYTVMGDAMNLGARLMAKADRGEIVASRPMIDWAGSNIEYEPLEPFMVKGKSIPIHAGRIGRVLGRRSDLDRVDSELCGRSEELTLLLDRADAARAGVGSVSMITGEPGIGKSRLVLEVMRQRPDLTIVFARCQPYDRLAAYSVTEPLIRALMGIDAHADSVPAGEALLAWLGERAPDVVPFAPLIAVVVGAVVAPTPQTDAVAPEFRRTRTLQLLVSLIQRAVTTGVAVFVDDINLADDATRELVAALTEAAHDSALMVMATSVTDEQLHPDPIRLEALNEADVSKLVDALLGDRAVSPDVVRAVVARSDGNPLFVGELIRSLAEDPNAPMPASLEALVASKVDALEPVDRQLLRQASVLGTDVDIQVLGRAIGDQLIRRQDRWERLSRFLEWASPGVVRFRYDTYWRVVYSGLSFSARRTAHRRVIDVLESDLDPADNSVITLLAAHADRAGDAHRAWRYATAAAHNAFDVAMYSESARLFEIALESRSGCHDHGQLVDVYETAGDVFERAAMYERAADVHRKALSAASDDTSRGRLLRKMGEVSERVGDYSMAARRFAQARKAFTSTGWTASIDELAQLEAAVAGLAYRQGRYGDAWQSASAALSQATLIRQWRAAAKAALIIDNVRLNMKWHGVDVDAPDVLGLYTKANDRVGAARYMNNQAVDLYFEGDWDRAARLYRDAAAQCAISGDVVYEATALSNIAEMLSDQGRYDDAESLFRTANRTWQSVGFATGVALSEANLGRLATRTGQYEKATVLLSSSLERFVRMGARRYVDEVGVRLVENALASGETLTAQRVDDLLAVLARPDLEANCVASAHRALAAMFARLGDRTQAASHVNTSIECATAADIPFERAQSLALRADLSLGVDDDASDRSEANAIFDRLGVLRHDASKETGSHERTGEPNKEVRPLTSK